MNAPRCFAGGVMAGSGLAIALAMACAGSALAMGSPKRAPEAIAYEAEHGAWSVHCDVCASYEETMCVVTTISDIGSLGIFPMDETVADPPLAITYFPSRALAHGTSGTLTVEVNGERVGTFGPPDVIYTEMYGDLWIEDPAVAKILPALRAGGMLALTYSDADGAGTDQISLDGLAAAIDDMRRRLPMERPSLEELDALACYD